MSKQNDDTLTCEKKPIYKLARENLNLAVQISANFPKNYKYSLGKYVMDAAIKMCRQIFLIYNETETEPKLKRIKDLEVFIHDMLVLVRLSTELNHPQIHLCRQQVATIFKILEQTKKWYNYIKTGQVKQIVQNDEKQCTEN